jgi:hypothetical protein
MRSPLVYEGLSGKTPVRDRLIGIIHASLALGEGG